MKRFFKIFTIAVLLSGAALFNSSCSKDNKLKIETIAVNYVTINGIWKLDSWCGKPLPANTYCYIEFDRTEKSFKMYQNMDSMYARYITGKFSIVVDPHRGTIIMGEYDYNNGEWNNDYIITDMLETGSMIWTACNDSSDYSHYIRVSEIPAEILAETENQLENE